MLQQAITNRSNAPAGGNVCSLDGLLGHLPCYQLQLQCSRALSRIIIKSAASNLAAQCQVEVQQLFWFRENPVDSSRAWQVRGWWELATKIWEQLFFISNPCFLLLFSFRTAALFREKNYVELD